MQSLEAWQWVLGAIAAAGIGISKTGIAGLGIVAVALFAIALPGKVSVGVVLPILLCGDVVAVTAYRRHAVWSHLWMLYPWAALGIVAGYFAMGHIGDQQVGHLIGGILVVLVVLQIWRRRGAAPEAPAGERNEEGAAAVKLVPGNFPLAITLGLMAGFTTMVANAAGPIMILYLLTMRLPKNEFIGTAAWYFLVLNLFKVPFSVQLKLINPHSLPLDLFFGPFAVLGALYGRTILQKIDQALFEKLALALTAAAAIKLLI